MGQGFVRVHFQTKFLFTDEGKCFAFLGEIKQVFIAEMLDFVKAILMAALCIFNIA